MPGEYMTLNEAAEELGVSRVTIWRRIQKGQLEVYQSEQDQRMRLVKRSDIERMKQPIRIDPTKKAAA
jgi:excisionase family DNA binding protein